MAYVVNIAEIEEITSDYGTYWGSCDKPLTPGLQPRMGRLGVNATRVKPGHSGCPFHTHHLEDEVFFVLSGRGALRYGDEIREIKPGDCISCPAGSGTAHQIANIFDEDLVYLAIGMNEPNEVCTYPDSGKVSVRALGKLGILTEAAYFNGEPETPKIFKITKP